MITSPWGFAVQTRGRGSAGRGVTSAVLLVALLFSTGACSHAGSAKHPDPAEADPRNGPYVIGPADVLRVTVWKNPELSAQVAVEPGGTITVPLIGELHVAGCSPKKVQEDVAARLAAYVNDAVVTVAVVEVNSYRFTVAGSVEHRGMFTPRYYVTLSEAIALAGGPTRYASTSDVTVIRRSTDQRTRRMTIDYDKILSGKTPDRDIVILAGDTVLVP
jgi:polysaccharide export outer membrane protein